MGTIQHLGKKIRLFLHILKHLTVTASKLSIVISKYCDQLADDSCWHCPFTSLQYVTVFLILNVLVFYISS
jgi:hypothetical protein